MDFDRIRSWMSGSRNLAGPLITIPGSSVVETLLQVGPDMLIADMEHSLIEVCDLQEMCIAAGRTPVFARIRGLEKNVVKKVLDTGVAGIIVPGIENEAEAELAVRYSRFAPGGVRGAGPGRASGYGYHMARYLGQAPLIFVQIETKSAYERVADIARVHGIDGLFIGPFDLTVALQIEFSWNNPEFVETVGNILKEARKNGLLAGMYSPLSGEGIAATGKLGFNFLMLGMDREAMRAGYSEAIGKLRKA